MSLAPPRKAARSDRGLARFTLPAATAFWLVGGISLLMLFASAAASPLYRVYQAEWGFSTTTLTTIFAVYVLALLLTLLFLGGLSDYVGRRPMLLAGVAAQALACVLFLTAHGVANLYLARIAQGIGVGLSTSAIGAALLELRPDGLAPLVSTSAPNLGLASGALVTSALVEYGPAQTDLVWELLLAIFVAVFLIAAAVPETRAHRPVASLRPHIAIPPPARSTFLLALPSIIAVWSLGGFYLSLGPSLSADLVDSRNRLWGGLMISILTGFGALASAGLRKRDPQRVMLAGCVALTVGALTTFGAIVASSEAALVVGTAVAGLGFGPGFTGAYRAIVSQAEPDDRAGVIAAVFIAAYGALGGPSAIAGLGSQQFGLQETALVFAAGVAILAIAVGVRSALRGLDAAPSRAIAVPPGPCTVPPCPQPGAANLAASEPPTHP